MIQSQAEGPASDNPAYLYKYRSLDKVQRQYVKQIIIENKMWFASPTHFNDPFDCSPVLTVNSTKATRRNLQGMLRDEVAGMTRNERRAMRELAFHPSFKDHLRKAREQSLARMGVLSLSALPDQVLMWSHYADAHKGICLRLNPTLGDTLFAAAQRVIYSAKRPILSPAEDDAEALVDKSILTKADFWAYEEEWRVVRHEGCSFSNKGGPGLVDFDARALDGIILGACISDHDAAEVELWTQEREHPVELLRARPNDSRFSLDIVPNSVPMDIGRVVRISGRR